MDRPAHAVGPLLCLLCCSLFAPVSARAQTVLEYVRSVIIDATGPSPVERTTPATVVQRDETPPTPPEEPFDEGLFEDARETPAKVSEEGKTPAAAPRKISIDAAVMVDYVFFHSGERFKVKYSLNLGGEIPQDVVVLRGSARISTDVSGYLAKWSQGECLLKVSISEVPYEITFKKSGENQADIELKFTQPIVEDWESLCTFLDDPGAKFNTRGNPEKWIAEAFEKASPSLNKLATPLQPDQPTTLKFTVPKHTVRDENIGSAEIDGTGVVTIQPAAAPPAPAP